MKLGGQAIGVINSGTQTGTTDMGSPVYGDQVATIVTGCSIQEHQTRREIGMTDIAVSRLRLFAPPTAPLTSTSKVVIGFNPADAPNPLTASWLFANCTTKYISDGEPAFWQRSDGVVDHIECYLREQVASSGG